MNESNCCQGSLNQTIGKKLGRCRRCIRWSALAALVCWLAVAIISLFWPHRLTIGLILLLATIFTALLVSHLGAVLLRVTTAVAAVTTGTSLVAWQHSRADRRALLTRLLLVGIADVLVFALRSHAATAAPRGWTTLTVPCGTRRAMYRNTTGATQRLTFRISVKAMCGGGNLNVYCGRTFGGGANTFPSAGETHDILCELVPGEVVDIECPRGDGDCTIEWTINVTSTYGTTTRRCGSDNDIFGNATSTPEPVRYVVWNEGDCPWQPTCNGAPITRPGTRSPVVVAPGGLAAIVCKVDGGSVLAGLCTAPAGNCTLQFRRLP
jgi:hypothetical protein